MRSFGALLVLFEFCSGIYGQSSPTMAYITTDRYDWVYDDRGTGADEDFSVWRPKAVPGYFAVGDVAKAGHSRPTIQTVLVKELVHGSLAMPTGSNEIWNDRGSGGRYDIRVMQLIPPAGYVCLGHVAVNSYSGEPNYSFYRCVKETYLTNGHFLFIWKDTGSGAFQDFSAYQILAGSSSSLSPNGFSSHNSHAHLACCPKVLSTQYLKKERYLVSDFPLCKLDTIGSGYAATEFMTSSEKTCRHWSQMSQEQKQGFPTNLAVPLEQNYCRNPNGRPEGPWCYVGTGVSNWEYCSIPICKPSASCTPTSKGETYVGTRSMTKSGRSCQRWDSLPSHKYHTQFPDGPVSDAANFCRNPGGQKDGLWCYTTDQTKDWEYCDVPMCSDCKETKDGRGYAGTKATDKDGRTCNPWSQTSYRNNELFPDVSVSAASNYCRNPDGDGAGPWCMVSGGRGHAKSDCGLPLCQTDTCIKSNSKRGSIKHVLHVGIDGLHSTCWQNTYGGTPHLLSVASQGSSTYNNARAEIITYSGPNWGAHLCGMGIQSTGITSNSWTPPWKGARVDISPVNGNTYPMPCAFNYMKGFDKSVRTGMFYNWNWFNYLGNGGIPGFVDVQYTSSDAEVVSKASDYLKKALASGEKSYTFVHMDQVDAAGHSFTWCSILYKSAVDRVDALLGKLLDVVGDKPVLIIISSDHGGDFGHGHMRDSNLLIPMFIKGPGVRSGYSLTRPVRNRDILPTAAWALGVKASPFWDGHVMEEIFEE